MRTYAIEYANGRAEVGAFPEEDSARRWLQDWVNDHPDDLDGAKLIDRGTREVLWTFTAR
jgi:hypothetical protein